MDYADDPERRHAGDYADVWPPGTPEWDRWVWDFTADWAAGAVWESHGPFELAVAVVPALRWTDPRPRRRRRSAADPEQLML